MDFRQIVCSAVSALFSSVSLFAGDAIPFQTGNTVAFLGDSITDQGWKNKSGYVHLVIDGLKRAGVDIRPVPAGISGHNSAHMRARVDKDVIRKKPDWMFLSCGVNDAPNGIPAPDGNPGIPLSEYNANIRAITDKCAAAGIRVIILSATPVLEEPEHQANKNLIAYNDTLKKIAAEKNLPLIDLNKACNLCIQAKKNKQVRFYTVDGTHASPQGDIVLASAILRGLNVPEETIREAREDWMSRADGWQVSPKLNFSVNDMMEIHKIKGDDVSLDDWVKSLIREKLSARK